VRIRVASVADLKFVYLIHGPEPVLLDRALARLRARFADFGDLDFSSDTFDADNADVDDIIAACNTFPFDSERRLVVVRNVEKFPASVMDRLAAYAADPAPFTTLVLVAAKVNKGSKLYKAVEKSGQVAEYKAEKRDYPAYVTEMFASKGRRVDRDGIELLLEAVGNDLRRLEIEVSKAVSFAGDQETLTRADIAEVLSTSAPTSLYEFLDALASRDATEALALERDLIDEGESVYALHAMAVRRMRELVAAQTLAQRGSGSAAALAATLGRQEWQIRRIPQYATRFGAGEPADLLRKAAATEADMKTSRDPRLAFERWILAVCGR
jgi:DNA polymerase III subunit delta